ncbi:MAG TPA: SagB/ThcOx family dehydrogenase [Rhodopila sp.]|nr:SagB/ThcOx family dehydrogenase [Rhodopila sp.]
MSVPTPASVPPGSGTTFPPTAPSDGPLPLPSPRSAFGQSLSTALRNRHSVRTFDTARNIPLQQLSELLWCACGVNRPDSGGRTAPSWRDAREVEIFISAKPGVWRYDAVANQLLPHLKSDIRPLTATPDLVAGAPIELIYVGHRDHLASLPREDQYRVASTDSGFIAENIYLYCASEGLATVFRTSFDHSPLVRALRLDHRAFVTFVQSVGYPAA